ncbi:MAG TPA: 6-phosphogluconolactonase [Bryobacteraceae bacterium]|nr:6-phosphogluconolactonase [Bryobacteraceae bacterium]
MKWEEIFLAKAGVGPYIPFMGYPDEVRQFHAGVADVHVFHSRAALGAAAARRAAELIVSAIEKNGRARIMVATGNSQLDAIGALVRVEGVPWHAVEVFHMDEYVGISENHPASFRHWIRTRLADRVYPGQVNYIEGDAADLEGEIRRYSALLNGAAIDVGFVGFGENGHIAFNDPHVADFDDPVVLKRVVLDEACRRQQAGEGHFVNAEAVPREAVTVTCSGLFRISAWVSCVPELRKATAVRRALEGVVSESCPASRVRRHPNAEVFLDTESASLLSSSLEGVEALA